MRIAIDFDDTIMDNSNGSSSMSTLHGAPIDDSIEYIKDLLDEGHEIVVFTARKDLWRVEEWLKRHGLGEIEATNTKPSFDLYIDDKGMKFDGDWQDMMEQIHEYEDSYQGNPA